MGTIRRIMACIFRPHRTVREARVQLDVDRQQIAELTARADASAELIHERVHVENNISAAVRATLRGIKGTG